MTSDTTSDDGPPPPVSGVHMADRERAPRRGVGSGRAGAVRILAVGLEDLRPCGPAPAAGVLDQFTLFRHAQALAEPHMHMITHEGLLSLTSVITSS